MKIGIVGTGNVGATLARQLGSPGNDNGVANSRGPETAHQTGRADGRHTGRHHRHRQPKAGRHPAVPRRLVAQPSQTPAGPTIGGESAWSGRPAGQPAGAAIRGQLSLGSVAAQHHARRILRLRHRSRPWPDLPHRPTADDANDGASALHAEHQRSECRRRSQSLPLPAHSQPRDSTPHTPTSTNAVVRSCA
jgi:hypothetical protein